MKEKLLTLTVDPHDELKIDPFFQDTNGLIVTRVMVDGGGDFTCKHSSPDKWTIRNNGRISLMVTASYFSNGTGDE